MTAGTSISVLLPAHNGREFIGQALESVLRQTAPAMEIIVVDDASTDGTADVVNAMREGGPVRLLRLDRNSGGPARPLNVGLAAATGDYIAVIDQDDVFLPEKLDRQARQLDEHPDCGFVFSLCAGFETPETVLQDVAAIEAIGSPRRVASGARVLDGPSCLRRLLEFGNFVCGFPAFMFRRSMAEARGGFDESFRIAADYDFLCWLCMQGNAAYLPEIAYLKRFHTRNLCNARYTLRREVYRVRRRFGEFQPEAWRTRSVGRKAIEAFSGTLGLPRLADARHDWIERTKALLRRCMSEQSYARLRSLRRGLRRPWAAGVGGAAPADRSENRP